MSDYYSLPELPHGWVYTQLGDLIEPSKEKIDPSVTDTLRYIGLEHIEKDTGKILSYGTSEEVTSTKSIFYEGDLLYGKLRPYLNKVCVPDFNGVCSTDILVFKKSASLSNKYLKYRMLCQDFVRFANQNSTGVNHPRVDYNKISTFILPLPPLAEQHRIVAKIEELFTKLDAGVVSLKKAKLQLNQYRQAILQSAFEGKITRQWRQDNKEYVEKCSQYYRKLSTEPIEYSGLQATYNVPDSWVWITLSEIILSMKNGVSKRPKESESGVIVLRLADVAEGVINICNPRRINLSTNEIDSYRLTNGDLLFVRVNGSPNIVGRSILYEDNSEITCYSDHLIKVSIKSDLYNPKFLSILANSSMSRKYINRVAVTTAGQMTINQSMLLKLPIIGLPLQEQNIIVKEIDSRFSIINEIEKLIDQNLARLASLRRSLLDQAFSGQLVPQDPNDEPAEKLLERIRAERAQKDGSLQTVKARKARKQASLT
ncbi:MAG: EcoKI restriction-modification system protein HsdS [Methanocella sp. PtaU1.Bin125]|nr:MAG: EcoKI restriction-modification system protein HsdS [Methanocella sp. PtaU1.Bin125]